MIFYLVSCVLIYLVKSDGIFENFEYSLNFPYSNPKWNFYGYAMAKDNHIVVTPDDKSRHGSVWLVEQNPFRDWILHVQFQIYGHGENLYGDGLGIWYTKDYGNDGTVFANQNPFTGLGVLLDTYNNVHDDSRQHPYISVQLSDGTWLYNHDKDGTDTQLMGQSIDYRGADKHPTLIVSYINNFLEVNITFDHFTTIQPLMKIPGVHLPTHYHFGVSAATGDLSDMHAVTSIKLFPVEVHRTAEQQRIDSEIKSPSTDFRRSPLDHQGKTHHHMSKKKTILVILLTCIGIGVLLFVGMAVFKPNKSPNRLY